MAGVFLCGTNFRAFRGQPEKSPRKVAAHWTAALLQAKQYRDHSIVYKLKMEDRDIAVELILNALQQSSRPIAARVRPCNEPRLFPASFLSLQTIRSRLARSADPSIERAKASVSRVTRSSAAVTACQYSVKAVCAPEAPKFKIANQR